MKTTRVVVHLQLPHDLAQLVRAEADRKGQSITRFVERTLRGVLPKKKNRS